MRPKEIYELYFPYQEGQGGKDRPVLVFCLTTIEGRFIGLKITKTERRYNRVKIEHWKKAGLDCESYIQCDNYSVFENVGTMKYKGILRQSDYNKVVLKLNEFYPILKWLEEEQQKELK